MGVENPAVMLAVRIVEITHDEMGVLYSLLGTVMGLLLTAIGTVVWTYVRQRNRMRTNHGSKNIGDAMDRLTDAVARIQATQEAHYIEQQRRNDQQDERLHAGSKHMQRLDDTVIHYHGGMV